MPNPKRLAFDQYLTPASLARDLLRDIEVGEGAAIADFSVGKGDLLAAADSKYKDSRLFGCDIDPKMIRAARKRIPQLTGWRGNFLEQKFYDKIASKYLEGFDLVTINPPFSFCGFSNDELGSFSISCSAHYLLRSLSLTRVGGVLAAVIPGGFFHSRRDRPVLELITRYCNSIKCSPVDFKGFGSCDVKVGIVKVRIQTHGREIFRKIVTELANMPIRRSLPEWLCRGRAASPRRGENLEGIIHTTDLDSESCPKCRPVNLTSDCAEWLVAFPRVGRIRRDQITIFKGGGRAQFSSCVLLLGLSAKRDALLVRQHILQNWASFRALYGGTAAEYTSLETQVSYWEAFSAKANIKFAKVG